MPQNQHTQRIRSLSSDPGALPLDPGGTHTGENTEARRFCDACAGRVEHRAMCPTISGRNWSGHRTFAGADRYFECEGCTRSWPSRLLDDYGFCPDCLKRIAAEPFDPDRPF